MVIKLLPTQVSAMWDYIRKGLEATKPAMVALGPEGMINILKNLLVGTLQCWAIVDEEKNLEGFFLTTIADDYVSRERFLNVYDLYSFKPLAPGALEACMKAGFEFARANKCSRITAYSDIPQIIELAKKFGFRADCAYLVKEVK